jgi:serine/threonine protein kinase
MAIHLKDLTFETPKIGEGATATVWKAHYIRTPIPVAVKQIPKTSTPICTQTQIIREITIHRQFDHPFISKLFDVIENETDLFLVQELLERGSLLSLINTRVRIPEKIAHRYFIQLICAIDHLHRDRHVAHRDIKCENILLDKFENIRVIDFGLSRAVQGASDICRTQCGSPAYVAPEVVLGKGYGTSADIWSCGIVLFGMVTGYLPFFDSDPQQNLKNIVDSDLEIPPYLSSSLSDLISRILCKDPKARINLDAIIKHPWVWGSEYQMVSAAAIRYTRPDSEIEKLAVARMSSDGINCAGLTQALAIPVMTEIRVLYEIYTRICVSETMQTVIRRAESARSASLPPSIPYGRGMNQKHPRGSDARTVVRVRYPVPIVTLEMGHPTLAGIGSGRPQQFMDCPIRKPVPQAIIAASLPKKGAAGI